MKTFDNRISFPSGPTQFLGRNGSGKCVGVNVLHTADNSIMLEPITSRGLIGRCFIEVPDEAIDGLITLLEQVKEKVI
jgi:hypothetical protein